MLPFWAVLQTGMNWGGVPRGGVDSRGNRLRGTEQGFVMRHQCAVSGGAKLLLLGKVSLLGLERTKEGGTTEGVEGAGEGGRVSAEEPVSAEEASWWQAGSPGRQSRGRAEARVPERFLENYSPVSCQNRE